MTVGVGCLECERYAPTLTHFKRLCPAVHICGEFAGLAVS